MWHRTLTFLGLACIAINGCGTEASLPESKLETKSTEASSIATLPANVAPAPVSTAAPATKHKSSPYRDLVARYLDSDGQGVWRKNEKAATELEQLSAEQIAQLWP